MNEFKTFRLARKRTLVLMQEWLRGWEIPPVQPLYCPKCQGEKVRQMMKSVNRKTLRCIECNHEFSLEDLPECRCTYPGKLLTCLDCKHYQDMIAYVERNQARFCHVSEEELDSIIKTPGFLSRNMEPKSPTMKNEQAQHEQIMESSTWSTINSFSVYQLSLFEGTFSEVKDFNIRPENESI